MESSNIVSGSVPLQSAEQAKFPRLGRPVPMMRPEYDVVVVGSGYGGGVAASRMARAGKSVAVLELGKEKWPGEYPSNLEESGPEFHVSGNLGRYSGPLEDVTLGRRTGLYHLIFGEGQNAFVGNGLGGTSLLNANVFLEADTRTLQLSNWPEEIRKDPACLDPYYDRAAEMLQPVPYPKEYPALKKLQVLEKQAEALGQADSFYRVPQTTFFHDALNNAGVEMKASTGSGQDSTGVNDGSKNSVLMNYLPDAWNRGAEIFCECEVRYIHKDPSGSGYIVFFAWHGDGRDAFEDDFYNGLMWLRAKEFCFLGAGALGTTEILLRSKAHGLEMSRLVGQKLSGNGDLLAFGYNTDEVVNGLGSEDPPAETPCGPTITGVIDNRGPDTSPNVLDGYVIEEGAIPQALASLIQAMLEALPGKVHPDPYTTIERLRHLLSATESRFFGPYAKGGSVERMQTYLIMSHDSNEAIVTLENDEPYLQFLGVGRTEHVKKLHDILADATKAIGGTLINSPFYAAFDAQREITVHPLGGAILSADGKGRSGATNHVGQLFTGEGVEVHEGLFCVDGSVIPTALGVNPFATITALAERSLAFITNKNDLTSDMSRNHRLDLFGKPSRSFALTPDLVAKSKTIRLAGSSKGGIRFTEIMDGYIHLGPNIHDFVVAENVAKGASSAAKLYLSTDAYSVETLIESPDHTSLATGTFSCGALSSDPMLVLRGEVQFFTVDQTVADGTDLVYKLKLLNTAGETYLLNGYKKIDASMAFSVHKTWKATTTLYTTITRIDGSMVGRGILHVSWRNFESEMKSFGGTSGGTILSKIISPLEFLSYFARKALRYCLAPLSRLEYPDREHTGYLPRVAPSQIVTLTARDGIQTTMKVWVAQGNAGQVNGTQKKLPLLMIPGASVNDEIFSLPTIPTNTVDYFTSHGYTVYVPVLRFGRTPAALQGYTAYDARLDVEAAMKYVHGQHPGKMLILCHCVGAIATSMGLLDGTLPPEWIQGLAASQVFFLQHFGRINAIKGRTSLLPNIYRFLAGGPWLPMNSTPEDPSLVQLLLDQVLRLYPVGATAELCTSTVCHRCSLVFGRLWNHANLTHATHKHLINFFGGLHMNMLTHLTRTGTAGHDLDNAGNDLVTDANVARLQGVPMLFLSGGDNVVFDPVSTSMCYNFMRERFGPELYRRVVVGGYGHLDTWMGKRSKDDVYPAVREHLEWFERFVDGNTPEF
ncbi:hypothetical protein DFH07DRAFT_952716 [Mycena maculata]|uniref:Cholesterol oxidase n=1 Tax=Mycena maculata TaxID=230809 RepID=A0AAD7NST9_9AGAR|nr:hypothetical protein DFH07DRAFT_952716 [Mycena maculata]